MLDVEADEIYVVKDKPCTGLGEVIGVKDCPSPTRAPKGFAH